MFRHFFVTLHQITTPMSHRLLVIDSDISLSTVLSDYLDSKGYHAQHVSSAQEALRLLYEAHFDLVLMELQGLQMNGFELLRDIRRRYMFLPIIILTSRNDRESQMRAFQLGCDDYQIKPLCS